MSLKTDVVKGEIPLFISKGSMKTAESKIEFVNYDQYVSKRYSLALYNQWPLCYSTEQIILQVNYINSLDLLKLQG